MTINVLETGCLNVYVPLTQSGDLLNIADLGREDPRKHVNNEEHRFDDSRIPWHHVTCLPFSSTRGTAREDRLIKHLREARTIEGFV